MKKIAFLLIFFTIAETGVAQDKWTGIWEGKLDVGMVLRIVFHISQAEGKYQVKMDSPDQQALGFKADSVHLEHDSIYVQLKKLRISFSGVIKRDSLITGILVQGRSIPLNLTKVEAVSKINRPQTPVPPFPYEIEDVVFYNADSSLSYGATITYPSIPAGRNYIKAPTYPVAVLISGSGAQDRNEEIMHHKPFAVIADALTKKGFLVIRTDDRGVGKSTGNFNSATSLDFADDIMSVTDYLKRHKHADSMHIFLVGHSEGGMIAPIVANRRKDIYGIVSLAGVGIAAYDVLAGQNAAMQKSVGISDTAVQAFDKVFRKLLTAIRKTSDTAVAYASALKILNKWQKSQPSSVLEALEISKERDRQSYIRSIATAFTTPWFHYFLNFDPSSQIKKLQNVHILVLNGDRDIQVLKEDNIPAFEKYLKKSKVTSYTIKTYPDLNHLFQHCTTCTVAEYGTLEETISPEVLNDMSEWMTKVLSSQ